MRIIAWFSLKNTLSLIGLENATYCMLYLIFARKWFQVKIPDKVKNFQMFINLRAVLSQLMLVRGDLEKDQLFFLLQRTLSAWILHSVSSIISLRRIRQRSKNCSLVVFITFCSNICFIVFVSTSFYFIYWESKSIYYHTAVCTTQCHPTQSPPCPLRDPEFTLLYSSNHHTHRHPNLPDEAFLLP